MPGPAEAWAVCIAPGKPAGGPPGNAGVASAGAWFWVACIRPSTCGKVSAGLPRLDSAPSGDCSCCMQQLQSPLGALSSRGKPALTLPQVLGLMQATQNQAPALATPALPGGPPAGLPGAMQTAQASAGPGIFAPARPSPAAAGSRRSGPRPGPSAVSAG